MDAVEEVAADILFIFLYIYWCILFIYILYTYICNINKMSESLNHGCPLTKPWFCTSPWLSVWVTLVQRAATKKRGFKKKIKANLCVRFHFKAVGSHSECEKAGFMFCESEAVWMSWIVSKSLQMCLKYLCHGRGAGNECVLWEWTLHKSLSPVTDVHSVCVSLLYLQIIKQNNKRWWYWV